MEIPEYIRAILHEEIYENFEGFYQQYVEPKRKINSTQYIEATMNEVYEELESLIEVTNDQLYPILNKRQMTKKRWVEKELSSSNKSGFHHKIDTVAKLFYEEFKKTDIGKFQAVYGFATFEELRNHEINELQQWAKEHQSRLIDYPYLESKMWTQIEKAIDKDIRYHMIQKVKTECPFGEQNTVVQVPNTITNFPYDPTNRKRLNTDEVVDSLFYRGVQIIDDKTKFESRINIEVLQEGLMKENLKMLNSLDQDILIYLMTLNHEALYQPIPMVVEIGEIVRGVYGKGNDSQYNYLAVKNSLIKMDFMELRIIEESSLRTTKAELFHKVTIELDEVTKKEVARIIFSEDLIHEFVKNQTVSIYKKTIDKFTLNSAKILIIPLQRQRIYCASQVEEGEKILFHTNITFFRNALVFGKRRRKSQIEIIEKALDEIVSHKITLLNYERKGDNFILEFYPFTDKEKKDLLENNAPEKFLLTMENEEKSEQLKLTM